MVRSERNVDIRRVHVLIRPEGDYYVAQCLEFDLAAQARTIAELKKAFERTVVSHIILALEHNDQPFEKLSPAPQEYRQDYERGEKLTTSMNLGMPEQARRVVREAPQEAEFVFA